MIISIALLEFFGLFGLIKSIKLDRRTATNMIPLSAFYFGNVYFGLGGTKLIKY